MALRKLGSAQTGWATTVWCDPGGTTGWGVMALDPAALAGSRPIHTIIQHWSCGEAVGNENQMASQMLELYAMWDDAAIGCEDFQLRQLAVELSPATVRAKIEYGLWLGEKWAADEEGRDEGRPRRLWLQMASMAKQKLDDDRQRRFKLWEPGKDHKRDAVKHCYTFMSRARENPRMRFNAWPNLFRQDGSPLSRRPPTKKGNMR
jgi:hypothetical protein